MFRQLELIPAPDVALSDEQPITLSRGELKELLEEAATTALERFQPPLEPLLYRENEAAERLGLTHSMLKRWREAGLVKSHTAKRPM